MKLHEEFQFYETELSDDEVKENIRKHRIIFDGLIKTAFLEII